MQLEGNFLDQQPPYSQKSEVDSVGLIHVGCHTILANQGSNLEVIL